MMKKIREEKIQRIREGGSPRVIDLFAGCGGLSLGFSSAGCKIVGEIEIDPLAAGSHAMNLYKDADESEREVHAKPRDIREIRPRELVRELGLRGGVGNCVDMLIGGPPCQAYSIVGRAKLREIMNDENAYMNDDRASLYLDYLEYVKELQPVVVLIENVPEIFRYGKRNVPQEIAGNLEELGYKVKYTILNSVFYGVPQLRDRMFLIAYAEEIGTEPSFPTPSHHYVLPVGYRNFRNDAVKKHKGNGKHFIPPFENHESGKSAVTAEEAIGDLPPITFHLEGKHKRGAIRFKNLIRYANGRKLTEYVAKMREWPGFENAEGVYDHVIRFLPRDYAIFERMEPNDEYPAAYAKALRLFDERRADAAKRGIDVSEGSSGYELIRKKTVPPYDPGKFSNKWRKLAADEPARTLTAHIGKDTYSHIHYSDRQARTISVREAARLQSFPDGFVFMGTLDPALRQIGNSVPPLLAQKIAGKILEQIKDCVPAIV